MRTLTLARAVAVILVLASCGQSTPPQHLFGTPSDWSIGSPTAKVVLVEYGDYQCPPCVTLQRVIEETLQKRGGDVRFIFRHYPTKRHRNAERAAEAAEAAGAQGRFWAMHAKLYDNQREWYGQSDPMEAFTRYARELGLDVPRFTSDVASKRFRGKIRASKEQAQQLGVRGAPALFVNGVRVRKLPMRSEDLEILIREAK